MIKKVWRGAFSYRRAVKIMYAYAFTKKQAWLIFCRRLAEKDDVAPSAVMGLFDGTHDNFEITVETEFQVMEEK